MFAEFLSIVFKSIKLDKSLYSDSKNFGEASVYFAGLIMILDGVAGAGVSDKLAEPFMASLAAKGSRESVNSAVEFLDSKIDRTTILPILPIPFIPIFTINF